MVMIVEHERHGKIEVTDHVHMLIEKDKREWIPQRTEPWYEKRRQHITASLIASICGDNPYESRVAALKKKVGCEPPFRGNKATEHGNFYEDIAIRKFEETTGEKVLEFGLLESLREGEEYLAGSPDGITASGKLIEVKCPYRRIPNGSVPGHYVHQIQSLMHMLNIEECFFIEYVPEGTWTSEIFSVVHVKRCEIFWNRIEPMLKRFWEDIMTYRNKGILPRELEEKETAPPKKKPRVITIGKKEPVVVPCLIPTPLPSKETPLVGAPPLLSQAMEEFMNKPDEVCLIPFPIRT